MPSSSNDRLCTRKNAALRQAHANESSRIDIKRKSMSRSFDSDLSKLQERLTEYKRRQTVASSTGSLTACSSTGSQRSANSSVSSISIEDECSRSAPDIRVFLSPEPSHIDRKPGCVGCIPGCHPALHLSLRRDTLPLRPLDQQGRPRRNSTIELRSNAMSPVYETKTRCPRLQNTLLRTTAVSAMRRVRSSEDALSALGGHQTAGLERRASVSSSSIPSFFTTSDTIDEHKETVTQMKTAKPLILHNIKPTGQTTIKTSTSLLRPFNRQRSKSVDVTYAGIFPLKPKKNTRISPESPRDKRISSPDDVIKVAGDVIKDNNVRFLPELVVTCEEEG